MIWHLCLWLKCRVSVNCRQWFVSISMECLDREECENKILKIDLCGHLPLIKPQTKANFAVGELALSKRLPLNQIFFRQRFGSAYRSIWTTATGFIPKYVNRNQFVESFVHNASDQFAVNIYPILLWLMFAAKWLIFRDCNLCGHISHQLVGANSFRTTSCHEII